MERQEPLTPTMLRTRYHEHRSVKPAGQPAGPLPRLAFDADGDAFEAWMAQADAGRIKVR